MGDKVNRPDVGADLSMAKRVLNSTSAAESATDDALIYDLAKAVEDLGEYILYLESNKGQ